MFPDFSASDKENDGTRQGLYDLRFIFLNSIQNTLRYCQESRALIR